MAFAATQTSLKVYSNTAVAAFTKIDDTGCITTDFVVLGSNQIEKATAAG